MHYILWSLCLLNLLLPSGAAGHETLTTPGELEARGIGLEEKTGQLLPPDITLSDEAGRTVRLKDLLGKPTILTFVYYTCEHICPQVLEGLSQALPRLEGEPGKDFGVITVSFDTTDTAQAAREAKKNYFKAMGRPFPEDAWRFLTGDKQSIDALTGAVGFRFRRDIHGFTHPVVLIFLAPDGKISRYFPVTKFAYGSAYPITFSSFDLNVALAEAAQGKSLTGLKSALLYCFSHEPPGQSKFFDFLAVIGLVTLAAMAAFFIYLQVTTRRYRRGKEYDLEK
ncbi:MAG: SCO family protein [Syntrophales bacterium]